MSQQTFTWSFTSPVMNLAKMKKGQPYAGIESEAHATEIGSILILWARYERLFNNFSEKILDKAGVSENKIKSLHYKKLADLTVASIDQVAVMPTIKPILIDIVDESKALQDIRNACSHGKYSWTAKPDGNNALVPIVHIEADSKSGPANYDLSVDDLETTRIAISNIAGKLDDLCLPKNGQWLAQVASPADIQTLAAILT